MESEFRDAAYRLKYEVNHFEDFGLDYTDDLEIVEFQDLWKCRISETDVFEHPIPIIYTSFWDVTKYIDYPNNAINWTVMSRKMYETLLSVGDFPHRLVPMVVIDCQVQPWNWYERSTITRDNAYKIEQSEWYKMGENLKNEVIHDDFVLVQLTEHVDILDYEKSVIDYDEDDPKEIKDVDEYVFKMPENGLPPIFRVKNSSYTLFVSTEARVAMKKAGVCGTRYVSLSGHQIEGEPDTDVPIELPAD